MTEQSKVSPDIKSKRKFSKFYPGVKTNLLVTTENALTLDPVENNLKVHEDINKSEVFLVDKKESLGNPLLLNTNKLSIQEGFFENEFSTLKTITNPNITNNISVSNIYNKSIDHKASFIDYSMIHNIIENIENARKNGSNSNTCQKDEPMDLSRISSIKRIPKRNPKSVKKNNLSTSLIEKISSKSPQPNGNKTLREHFELNNKKTGAFYNCTPELKKDSRILSNFNDNSQGVSSKDNKSDFLNNYSNGMDIKYYSNDISQGNLLVQNIIVDRLKKITNTSNNLISDDLGEEQNNNISNNINTINNNNITNNISNNGINNKVPTQKDVSSNKLANNTMSTKTNKLDNNTKTILPDGNEKKEKEKKKKKTSKFETQKSHSCDKLPEEKPSKTNNNPKKEKNEIKGASKALCDEKQPKDMMMGSLNDTPKVPQDDIKKSQITSNSKFLSIITPMNEKKNPKSKKNVSDVTNNMITNTQSKTNIIGVVSSESNAIQKSLPNISNKLINLPPSESKENIIINKNINQTIKDALVGNNGIDVKINNINKSENSTSVKLCNTHVSCMCIVF